MARGLVRRARALLARAGTVHRRRRAGHVRARRHAEERLARRDREPSSLLHGDPAPSVAALAQRRHPVRARDRGAAPALPERDRLARAASARRCPEPQLPFPRHSDHDRHRGGLRARAPARCLRARRRRARASDRGDALRDRQAAEPRRRAGLVLCSVRLLRRVPFCAALRYLVYIDVRTRREAWDVQVHFQRASLDLARGLS